MIKEQNDERFSAVLALLQSIASLDFAQRIELSAKADELDAIASGLNMLSEELRSNVVKRSELEEINGNLEKFAAIAAHDMRSPLDIAVSLTYLLEDELRDYKNEQVHEYLKYLRETNQRMSDLIIGILEYSKITLTKQHNIEVDLDKLFHQAAAQYGINENVVISIGQGIPVVHYSENALKQVVNNLIDNAIKYSDKEICQIEIECTDQGDQYAISVSDNGSGVPLEDRERIFNLFENLKSEKENSIGIGLAIAKKIITDYKGQIWVESSENKGARFVFTIKK